MKQVTTDVSFSLPLVAGPFIVILPYDISRGLQILNCELI